MRKFVATLISWDQRVVTDLALRRNRTLNGLMNVITVLGDGWLWGAILFSILFLSHDSYQFFYQISLAFGLQLCLHRAIKQTASRTRPFEHLENVSCIAYPLERYSFPSGHTSAAFVILATVGVFYSYLFLPLFLLALLIGFSRIYVGVHYPSDVFAGALLGIFSAELSGWLLR